MGVVRVLYLVAVVGCKGPLLSALNFDRLGEGEGRKFFGSKKAVVAAAAAAAASKEQELLVLAESPQRRANRRLPDLVPIDHRQPYAGERRRVVRVEGGRLATDVQVHLVPGHQHGHDQLGFQSHEMFVCGKGFVRFTFTPYKFPTIVQTLGVALSCADG